MRNLATVQTISNLEPIEGADKIVKATCLGWHVVVKKDEFKIGDKCVYIEIDSIVPKDNPVFEFLADRKYRVKTIKLRKQISQGLCLPIALFPSLLDKPVGTDVTDELKIVKYDPEIQKERSETTNTHKSFIIKFLLRFKWFRSLHSYWLNAAKTFPTDIVSKTDEDRIQACPSILTKNKGKLVSYTEKVDGQSYTATLRTKKRYFPFCSKYEFTIASRNLSVELNSNTSYADVTKRYKIKDILIKNIGSYDSIALQGEICGPGIQKNKYGLIENHLYVFRLKFNTANESIFPSQKDVDAFAKANNLEAVPYLGEFKLEHSVDDLVKLSSSENSKLDKNVKREGIVIREAKENYDFSFKVINPEFLLKYDE